MVPMPEKRSIKKTREFYFTYYRWFCRVIPHPGNVSTLWCLAQPCSIQYSRGSRLERIFCGWIHPQRQFRRTS
jgi:hypothetical protein